jgi:hypothetical protein
LTNTTTTQIEIAHRHGATQAGSRRKGHGRLARGKEA